MAAVSAPSACSRGPARPQRVRRKSLSSSTQRDHHRVFRGGNPYIYIYIYVCIYICICIYYIYIYIYIYIYLIICIYIWYMYTYMCIWLYLKYFWVIDDESQTWLMMIDDVFNVCWYLQSRNLEIIIHGSRNAWSFATEYQTNPTAGLSKLRPLVGPVKLRFFGPYFIIHT